MAEKILIILHQPSSTPGRVGQKLLERGYELDIRRPVMGNPLPATMEEHAGAVIFGGPQSANDPDDYMKMETDWIEVPLKEDAPFLGICLGAQMLAKKLGGEVGPHPEGYAEIGYYPLDPTEAGQGLMEWPNTVYQWHREGFTLPSDATLLAGSEMFENQAFSVSPTAFGIQFHAELTLAMMHRWTVRGAERLKMPGTKPRGEHFRGRARHDHVIRAWLDRFLDLWLASDARGRRATLQAAE